MFVVRDWERPAVWLANRSIYRNNKEAALCCAVMQLLGLRCLGNVNLIWRPTGNEKEPTRPWKQTKKQQAGSYICCPLKFQLYIAETFCPVCVCVDWWIRQSSTRSITENPSTHKKTKQQHKSYWDFILFYLLNCCWVAPVLSKFSHLKKKNEKINKTKIFEKSRTGIPQRIERWSW